MACGTRVAFAVEELARPKAETHSSTPALKAGLRSHEEGPQANESESGASPRAPVQWTGRKRWS